MFYKFIFNSIKDNTYQSTKPTHHINLYYAELKDLQRKNILKITKKSARDQIDGRLVILPSEYKVIDLPALQRLAMAEKDNNPVAIVNKYQQGKLLSLVNKYNSQDWTVSETRLKFNKGRCNAPIANLTTEHNAEGKQDRTEFNDMYFGPDNWCHYDVPSSIPQVIYLLNNKKWLGKRVWDMLTNPEQSKAAGQRTIFNVNRWSLAKSLFSMETGKKSVAPSKMNDWYDDLGIAGDSEYITMTELAEYRVSELESVIGTLPGKTKEERAEIFIHESNIYLLVLDKFIKAGAKVYEVYDSFYWNKDSGITEDIVNDWVKECAEYYIEHYDELMEQEKEYFSGMKIKKQKPSERMAKVRKWMCNHPGSTDFPSKWNAEELEYASRRLSEK